MHGKISGLARSCRMRLASPGAPSRGIDTLGAIAALPEANSTRLAVARGCIVLYMAPIEMLACVLLLCFLILLSTGQAE